MNRPIITFSGQDPARQKTLDRSTPARPDPHQVKHLSCTILPYCSDQGAIAPSRVRRSTGNHATSHILAAYVPPAGTPPNFTLAAGRSTRKIKPGQELPGHHQARQPALSTTRPATTHPRSYTRAGIRPRPSRKKATKRQRPSSARK